jgi:hypothetical protein
MSHFAVTNARSSRGQLDVAALENLLVAHRVLMFQRSIDDVAEYLELSMAMGSKSVD